MGVTSTIFLRFSEKQTEKNKKKLLKQTKLFYVYYYAYNFYVDWWFKTIFSSTRDIGRQGDTLCVIGLMFFTFHTTY